MDKRILATLCVTIFMLATLATVPQVSAHYTLGEQNPGSIGEVNAGGLPVALGGLGPDRFHQPPTLAGHVAGHIAFVQPGSLYIPPSDQLNYYSPSGAVITDTVGDLYFYVCLSDDAEAQGGPINISWRGTDASNSLVGNPTVSLYELSRYLYIAIPPEFTPPVDWAAGWGDVLTTNQGFGDTSNIETTITNDHNMIMTGKFGPRHPVAPNWWFVRITANPIEFPSDQVANLQTLFSKDGKTFDESYMGAPWNGNAGYLYPPNADPWADRQMRTGDFQGCYRIKIMNMKAPSCAGKQFFKIFYTSTKEPSATLTGDATTGWPDNLQAYDSPWGQVYDFDPLIGYLNGFFEKYDTFYPENYPVLLVKGEVDPGYITGTVRYCGHSQYYYGYYYGSGVHTSGKVVAEGTAIDPVTNEPTDRPVCGVGYFLGELPGQGEDWKDRETGSEGFYEIEGLAAGVYTLTAYAAGFVPRTLATQITVKRGQSIHGVDIYVCPTAKLQTKVYSKCPTGPVDWPTSVTLDTYPAGMQILPVVPGGAEVRGDTLVAPDGIWYWFTEGATTVQAKNIWANLMSTRATTGPVSTPELTTALQGTPIRDQFGWAWQELLDAEGNAVAYQDYTFDLAQDPNSFGTFWGDPSCYSGIETMWDGHVPTFLADFTSGIVPGQYKVRTWVFGYVQTKEYIVDFPAVEFPGTAYMEMDLFKGGTINATVHFHNQELPSAETAPTVGFSALIIEAYDANGVKQAWNSTDFTNWATAEDQSKGTDLLLVGESNAWCAMGQVHGMPEGTYTIKAFLNSYVQQEFPQTTIQYCTNSSLSFHLILGASICNTIYSRDCQDPSQPVDWKHPGENIRVDYVSSTGSVCSPDFGVRNWAVQTVGTSSVQICGAGGSGGLVDYFRSCGGFAGSGLPTDTYKIVVSTPGYVQLQYPEVYAQKGSSTGDIPVYLLVSPEIRVVVDFKTELMPAALPKDFWSYYFRIEAFDADGILQAANITAVPQASFATYSQYPWPGGLNPAQPDGVQSWVFQLQGYSPFSTPTNTPNWGKMPDNPTGGIWFWQIVGYNDKGPKTVFMTANNNHGCAGTGDHLGYGLMWGQTYTIVVTEENQIGYVQLATVTATPTCAGITTVIFEMDRMGRISGFVWARNWMGDFRAASWIQTTAAGATASLKAWGPMDGYYYTYTRPDAYTVTAELVPPGGDAGYKSASRTVVTTWGGASDGQDFYLEESGIPIPEFPAAGILALVSALAASLYLLRWRRQTEIPVR